MGTVGVAAMLEKMMAQSQKSNNQQKNRLAELKKQAESEKKTDKK